MQKPTDKSTESITYKPHDYDPLVGIDLDAAVDAIFAKYNVDSIEQLPLSAFTNYTAARDTLNIIQELDGAEQFIGNEIIYLSAGKTTTDFVSGSLLKPTNPTRNLLNINHPTINMVAESSRRSKEQIGGYFLPKHTTPLTYASFKHKPYILTDKLEPGKIYTIPDPTIYGNVYGNNSAGHNNPIDHIEDLSWVKTPPVIVGMQGRIRGSAKIPLYNGYTSREQTIGYPPHGTSRYTDNFDFWTGSVSGDIWANPDVYPLKEANKYDLITRGKDLLSDICDIAYKNKNDVYGNEYVIYKLGTEHPKKTAGGSDTNGDGKDDNIQPGLGDPDYYSDDGGVEPVFTETGGGGGGNGLGNTGDGGGDGEETLEEDGTGDDETDFFDYEFDEDGNVVIASCNYWLDGGGSLSPTVDDVKLDDDGNGTIELIVDGGWRRWNPAENPAANQKDSMVTPNGFVDMTRFNADSPTFDPATDIPSWFPNWFFVAPPPDATGNETEPLSSFRHYPRIDSRPTACANAEKCGYAVSFGVSGDVAYRSTTNRKENVTGFRMIIADGGWKRYGTTTTFFRTKCDRAAYILTTYNGDEPDFGNSIFACKMFRITENAKGYTGSETAREWYRGLYGDTEGLKRYVEDYAYALWRGPLDFTKHYNPIDYATNYIQNRNYMGTREQLVKDKQPPNRYDYLTEYEAFLTRISPIEGSGAWTLNEDTLTFTFFDQSEHTSRRAGFYSSPDIFYYLSGGEIDGVQYATVSGSTSYIQPAATTDDKIILDDKIGRRARGGENVGPKKATQFPQIPWDLENEAPYIRDYTVPLTGIDITSYDNLDCDTVCEYHFFDNVYVSCDNTLILDYSALTLNRTISNNHPVIGFKGDMYRSKRGYFPPPVGHFRRSQTHPLADDPAKIGLDEPIPSNMLPGLSGFYVHDVWDAGGFFALPGIVDTDLDDDLPPDADPPDVDNPVLPGPDDPTADCGPFTYPNQIGWIKKELTNGEFKCYPVFDDEGGGCEGCLTLSGVKIVNSCGDYNRYDVTIVEPVANPCGDGDVPLAHIAQLVKRSSDAGDACVVTPVSSLWAQKHSPVMSDPTQPLNVFFRNVHSDRIGTINELLPGLASTATSIGFDFSRSFIDFDIVYDIVVLRQITNTGMDTLLFDQIRYDYENNVAYSGDTNTYYVQADSTDDTTQLLMPFFNEQDNLIITGVIKNINTKLFPELHVLDIPTQQWSKIFPITESDPVLDNFTIPSGYTLIRVDPGEISYNEYTNNYTVTYIGKLREDSNPTNELLAIFNTVIYIKGDIAIYKTTDVYISDQPDNTDISSHEEVLRFADNGSVNVPAQTDAFDLTLKFTDLVGIDTGDVAVSTLDILYIDIDWGDNDTTTIWSQLDSTSFKSSFQRYGNQRIKGRNATILTDKTIIYTGSHPQQPRVADTSITNHEITHTYKLIGDETYTVSLTAYYNDNQTTFVKSLNIQASPYSINTTVSDVKLLSTKLYTPIGESSEKLLLTLETQSPRYVTHSVIDINS